MHGQCRPALAWPLLCSALLCLAAAQTNSFKSAGGRDVGDASHFVDIGSSSKLLPPRPLSLRRGSASTKTSPVLGPLRNLRGGGAEQPAASTRALSALGTPPAIPARKPTIVLFDVDGTLTPPRQAMQPEVLALLKDLHPHVVLGVVGGSDESKVREQLGLEGVRAIDFLFAENGLVAYHRDTLLGSASLAGALGEEGLQRLVNWCLGYLARVALPLKRGTFIEYRNGMLNVSPVGRNCSPQERNDFEAYDKEHGVRARMAAALLQALPELDLTCAIGGQVSLDVTPRGWDKTVALHFLPEDLYQEVHFFGDKTHVGGNDHELFAHPRTTGHAVAGPQDTVRICRELFLPVPRASPTSS